MAYLQRSYLGIYCLLRAGPNLLGRALALRGRDFHVDYSESKRRGIEDYLEEPVLSENPDRFLHLRTGSSSPHLFELEDSDWNAISVRGEQLLGFLGAWVDRDCDLVKELACVSFTEPATLTFARDALAFLHQLQTAFRVIRWHCVTNTRNEVLWAKAAQKLGGREVGRFTAYGRDLDHRIVDAVWFEVPGYGRLVRPIRPTLLP